MTVDSAIELCLKTLAAAGVKGYCVQVIEEFTDKPECYGRHRLHERTIFLSWKAHDEGRNEDELRATIQHEVAHAVCPNDTKHDPPFQVALERVRNLDVEGFCGPYRRWVDDEAEEE